MLQFKLLCFIADVFNAPKKSSLFDGADIDDNLFDAPKTAPKDSEKITDEPKLSESKKKKVGNLNVLLFMLHVDSNGARVFNWGAEVGET